ncbi:MAG: hypothetical protein LBK26_03305 [Rickettsiales bacterium]|jgi:hypothetical protein|nr:hypothetical protein [Rickettsiales bacterium]
MNTGKLFTAIFGAMVLAAAGNAHAAPQIKYNYNGTNYSAETDANKVKSISGGGTGITAAATDDQYPSAKAVKDTLDGAEQVGNRATDVGDSTTTTTYPTTGAVRSALNAQFVQKSNEAEAAAYSAAHPNVLVYIPE